MYSKRSQSTNIIIAISMIFLFQNCQSFRGHFLRQIIPKLTNFYSKKVISMSIQEISEPVRVRFAPSPTGTLHVGGARTALFNWLLAKKTNGKFIIRVEDTDEARSTRESEDSILNDLRWMNLNWDEGPDIGGPYGPYRQSERKEIYQKVGNDLISRGIAYPCFCTEEELEEKRLKAEAEGRAPQYDGTWRDADPEIVKTKLQNNEPSTVRFRVPANTVVSIEDIVRGTVTWDADASLGDFIILRSNGMPVYNFCVAVDDANMKITHVIRAEEHLTNTLRQILILEALGYTPPTYAHCSLILGSDRSKLSKRHGATSVRQFSLQGFLPDAMMNYLATLGWNDGTTKEIYSPSELIAAFNMSRIVKSAAVFDLDRLTWMNTQHLRAMPPQEFQPWLEKALIEIQNPDGTASSLLNSQAEEVQRQRFLQVLTKLAQPTMELVTDVRKILTDVLVYDLENTLSTDEHVGEILNDDFDAVVSQLVKDYKEGKVPSGAEENFAELWKAYMKQLGKDLGRKGKRLFHPVRLALTGLMSGGDIGEQLQVLALAPAVVNSEQIQIKPLEARIKILESRLVSA